MRPRHAEHRAMATFLLEDSLDGIESFDVSCIRVALLLDLNGIEHAVLFKDNVYLTPVLVAIVVDVRLFTIVPPALHDFRDDICLRQFAAHGTVFQRLRGIPAGEVTDQTGIHEVHPGRFYHTAVDVVVVGLEYEDQS